MKHKFFKSCPPEIFTEEDAPDWLTSAKTIKGSTMDNRWFWNEYILTLEIGQSRDTDFRTVTRVE